MCGRTMGRMGRVEVKINKTDREILYEVSIDGKQQMFRFNAVRYIFFAGVCKRNVKEI